MTPDDEDPREPLTPEQAAAHAALTAEGHRAANEATRMCARGCCVGWQCECGEGGSDGD